jgi:hypothetical protein
MAWYYRWRYPAAGSRRRAWAAQSGQLDLAAASAAHDPVRLESVPLLYAVNRGRPFHIIRQLAS